MVVTEKTDLRTRNMTPGNGDRVYDKEVKSPRIHNDPMSKVQVVTEHQKLHEAKVRKLTRNSSTNLRLKFQAVFSQNWHSQEKTPNANGQRAAASSSPVCTQSDPQKKEAEQNNTQTILSIVSDHN